MAQAPTGFRRITLPEKNNYIDFPDTMSNEDIVSALDEIYDEVPKGTVGEPFKRGVASTVRAFTVEAPKAVSSRVGNMQPNLLVPGGTVLPLASALVKQLAAGAESVLPEYEKSINQPTGTYALPFESLSELADPRRAYQILAENVPMFAASTAAFALHPELGLLVIGAAETGNIDAAVEDYEKRTGKTVSPTLKAFVPPIAGGIIAFLDKVGFDKVFGPSARRAFLRPVIGLMTEGTLEPTQELVSVGAEAAITGELPQNIRSRLLTSSVAGGVFGGAGGAGRGTYDYFEGRATDRIIEDLKSAERTGTLRAEPSVSELTQSTAEPVSQKPTTAKLPLKVEIKSRGTAADTPELSKLSETTATTATDLLGSTKQIAWASKLRGQIIDRLAPALGALVEAKTATAEELVEAVDLIRNEKKASWWIAQRDVKPEAILTDAVKWLRDKRSQGSLELTGQAKNESVPSVGSAQDAKPPIVLQPVTSPLSPVENETDNLRSLLGRPGLNNDQVAIVQLRIAALSNPASLDANHISALGMYKLGLSVDAEVLKTAREYVIANRDRLTSSEPLARLMSQLDVLPPAVTIKQTALSAAREVLIEGENLTAEIVIQRADRISDEARGAVELASLIPELDAFQDRPLPKLTDVDVARANSARLAVLNTVVEAIPEQVASGDVNIDDAVEALADMADNITLGYWTGITDPVAEWRRLIPEKEVKPATAIFAQYDQVRGKPIAKYRINGEEPLLTKTELRKLKIEVPETPTFEGFPVKEEATEQPVKHLRTTKGSKKEGRTAKGFASAKPKLVAEVAPPANVNDLLQLARDNAEIVDELESQGFERALQPPSVTAPLTAEERITRKADRAKQPIGRKILGQFSFRPKTFNRLSPTELPTQLANDIMYQSAEDTKAEIERPGAVKPANLNDAFSALKTSVNYWLHYGRLNKGDKGLKPILERVLAYSDAIDNVEGHGLASPLEVSEAREKSDRLLTYVKVIVDYLSEQSQDVFDRPTPLYVSRTNPTISAPASGLFDTATAAQLAIKRVPTKPRETVTEYLNDAIDLVNGHIANAKLLKGSYTHLTNTIDLLTTALEDAKVFDSLLGRMRKLYNRDDFPTFIARTLGGYVGVAFGLHDQEFVELGARYGDAAFNDKTRAAFIRGVGFSAASFNSDAVPHEYTHVYLEVIGLNKLLANTIQVLNGDPVTVTVPSSAQLVERGLDLLVPSWRQQIKTVLEGPQILFTDQLVEVALSINEELTDQIGNVSYERYKTGTTVEAVRNWLDAFWLEVWNYFRPAALNVDEFTRLLSHRVMQARNIDKLTKAYRTARTITNPATGLLVSQPQYMQLLNAEQRLASDSEKSDTPIHHTWKRRGDRNILASFIMNPEAQIVGVRNLDAKKHESRKLPRASRAVAMLEEANLEYRWHASREINKEQVRAAKLTDEQKQQVTKVIQSYYSGDQKVLDKLRAESPDLYDYARSTVALFRWARYKIQQKLLIRFKTRLYNKAPQTAKAFDLVAAGELVEDVLTKYPNIKRKTLESLAERYNEISEWGLVDYITKIEPGLFKAYISTKPNMSGEGIVAVGATASEAEQRAQEWLNANPEKKQELLKNGNKIFVDIFPERPKPLAKRKDILLGHKDLTKVMPAYIWAIHRQVYLEPVIEQVYLDRAKYPDQYPRGVWEIIAGDKSGQNGVIQATRGQYFMSDRIVDDFARSLGYGGEGRIVTRTMNVVGSGVSVATLGLAPIAGVYNAVDIVATTWASTSARHMAEAIKYAKTQEGRKLLLHEEKFFGTSVALEAEAIAGIVRTETGIEQGLVNKALKAFTWAEVPGRRLNYLSNYLFIKETQPDLDENTVRVLARQSLRFQMGIYEMAARSRLLRGPINAQVLFKFKTWAYNKFAWMASLDGKQASKYTTALLVTAGPAGLVALMQSLPLLWWFPWWDEIEQQLNRRTPEWGWFGNIIPRASRGVFGLLGVDVVGSAIPQIGNTFWDIVGGPTLKFMVDGWKQLVAPTLAGEDVRRLDYFSYIRSISRAARAWMDMVDAAFHDGWVRDSKGRPLYSITDELSIKNITNIAILVAGGTPTEVAANRKLRFLADKIQNRVRVNAEKALREFAFDLTTHRQPAADVVRALGTYYVSSSAIERAMVAMNMDPSLVQAMRIDQRARPEVWNFLLNAPRPVQE